MTSETIINAYSESVENNGGQEAYDKAISEAPTLEEIGTYKLPLWSIAPISYGDFDCITEEEDQLIQDFYIDFESDGWQGITFDFPDTDATKYWSHGNALQRNMGDDVVDVIVHGVKS